MYILTLLTFSAIQQYGYSIVDMANSPSVTVEVASIHLHSNGDAEFNMKIVNKTQTTILVDIDEVVLSSNRIVFASKGVPFRIVKKDSDTVSEIRGQRRAELKPKESLDMNRKFTNYNIQKIGKEAMDPLLINEKRNDVTYSMYFMMDIFGADRKVVPIRIEGSGLCTISFSLR